MSTDLEEVLLEDVRTRLARWQERFSGQPDKERLHLLRLSLEREQIVAVAYREEVVAGRLRELRVDPVVRALVRQTLIWIWKDEQLHAEYIRGELLRAGGAASHAVVYGRQVQGAISGWTSATANHRDPERAPFRAGAAGVLVAVAGLTKQAPPALRRELRFQTFRRYCELNVALEASAALAYRRLIEIAGTDDERHTAQRLQDDEERHVDAFRTLAESLTDGGALVPAVSPATLRARLGAISPWFIPAAERLAKDPGHRRPSFGSRAPVAVGSATDDGTLRSVLEDCLARGGFEEAATGARSAAIRASFMLGYDRRDMSNVNSPALLDVLATILRDRGVRDVAVLEAPTIYGGVFEHRSVAEVASYFGFHSDAYRIVDIGDDLRPIMFERGLVQHAVSATWMDADLRVVVPKLRTDPTELAHLCLSTLEGSTGSIADTFYAGRRTDFRSATMMLLDVAPPGFGIVDGWAPVADGPFGVMGCARPAEVRHVYAGRDILAVDEAVLADMGVPDPRTAPILRLAYHWFGIEPSVPTVDGDRPDLAHELRGAHNSSALRALGIAAYPIYVYMSDSGDRFVPAMDTVAFPARSRPGAVTSGIRWAAQHAFGLHAPRR